MIIVLLLHCYDHSHIVVTLKGPVAPDPTVPVSVQAQIARVPRSLQSTEKARDNS